MRTQIKIMLLAACLAACSPELEFDIPAPSYAHNAESHYMKKESAKQLIFEISEKVSANTVFDFYHDYYKSKSYKLCREIKDHNKSELHSEHREMSVLVKDENLVTVLKNSPYNFNFESQSDKNRRKQGFMVIHYKPGSDINKVLSQLNISCD